MHPTGALRRNITHLRAERGQHAPLGGHRLLGGVQAVEERRHCRHRTAVATGLGGVHQRRVAHPDTQQEPVTVGGGQRRVRRGGFRRRVHPQVQDTGRHNHPPGRRQQMTDGVEHRPPDVGNPHRAEAQLFKLGSRLGDLGRVSVTQGDTPDPHPRQIHDTPPSQLAHPLHRIGTLRPTRHSVPDQVP